MIRVIDTDNHQYYLIDDYIYSFMNDNKYGKPRSFSAVVTSGGLAKFTSTAHGLLTGQKIAVSGTTNYDGEYLVTVVDADTIILQDSTYVADESTGSIYPVMDGTYYLAYLQGVEDVFDRVKLFTANRGKNMPPEQVKVIFDLIVMDEDNRDLFIFLLKDACDKVHLPFQAYGKNIQNAYQFNQQVDFDADGAISEDTNYYNLFIMSLDADNQDNNMISQIDTKIQECLTDYVLKEWYMTGPLLQESPVHESRFNSSMRELRDLLMKLEGHKRVVFNEGMI